MKKKFIIKVDKEKIVTAEKILLRSMVDRYQLCNLNKLLELKKDPNSYFILFEGESYSCTRVLAMSKSVANKRGILLKVYDYDAIRTPDFDALVWGYGENSYGKNIRSYKDNPSIKEYVKDATTKFILKNGLLSNHVFCSECDGFADPITLTSLKGEYKCSFCDADVVVEGPLLTGKKPVAHLNEQEQLYLIGLPNIEEVLENENEPITGEQVILFDVQNVEPIEVSKLKRRRFKIVFDVEDNISQRQSSQLLWEI